VAVLLLRYFLDLLLKLGDRSLELREHGEEGLLFPHVRAQVPHHLLEGGGLLGQRGIQKRIAGRDWCQLVTHTLMESHRRLVEPNP